MAQPFEQQVAATATSSGTATFTFQAPPTGFWWTGTLNCPTAPSSAIFTATIGATQWGEWGGNSVYGPIQAQSNRQLSVKVTGLTGGASYVLTWLGSEEDVSRAVPVYPAANSTALTALISGAPPELLGSFSGGTGSVTNIPSDVRTLVLLIKPNLAGATCTNVTVNALGSLTYTYYDQPPYLSSGGLSPNYLVVVPVSPIGFANGYQVTTTCSTGTATLQISGDTTAYDESLYYNGVIQQANTDLSGSGSSILLTGPARLLTLELEVGTAVAGNVTLGSTSAPILRQYNNATAQDQALVMTFPPNTILQFNESLVLNASGTGASNALVTYAYP